MCLVLERFFFIGYHVASVARLDLVRVPAGRRFGPAFMVEGCIPSWEGAGCQFVVGILGMGGFTGAVLKALWLWIDTVVRARGKIGWHYHTWGIEKMTLKLTELIVRATWREAVTYRETWPHEYVLTEKDG